MQDDVLPPSRTASDKIGMSAALIEGDWSKGASRGGMVENQGAARQIRPLASFRFQAWRPGPPFWGPSSDMKEGSGEPERLLLPLAVPMFVTASVFISILLILS